MPNVNEVANYLVECCRENKTQELLNEMYADNAVSIEAFPMPGQDSGETQGLAGIKGKHEWWFNNHEVHSQEVEGPFMHGEDRFGVIFNMDVTDKTSNQRIQMQELAVYTVDGGKIVREEFFYNM